MAQKARPPMSERYEAYISAAQLGNVIRHLEQAYEQSPNVHVLKAMQELRAFQQRVYKLEETYREEELEEFYRNPGFYPHSVRVWILHYRDKEIS